MYKDSLDFYYNGTDINDQAFAYIKEITLYSADEIDTYTFDYLKRLLGKGQVIELDEHHVYLKDIEFNSHYDYSLTLRSKYDDIEESYLFRLLIFQDGTLLVQERFYPNYTFRVLPNLLEVNRLFIEFISQVEILHEQQIAIMKKISSTPYYYSTEQSATAHSLIEANYIQIYVEGISKETGRWTAQRGCDWDILLDDLKKMYSHYYEEGYTIKTIPIERLKYGYPIKRVFTPSELEKRKIEIQSLIEDYNNF